MLTVEKLRKDYVAPDGQRLHVLDIAQFTLAASERAALLGTSGGGKTTLLHVLAGILKADAGQVVYAIDGQRHDLAAMGEAARDHFRGAHLGYIFQTHHLLTGFSAIENVMLGMAFTGRPADRAWGEHLLERVGLKDRLHYRPGKLSLGQQQRVAVARALANRPKVVLADEPTGSLDSASAAATMDLIEALCGETGSALLVVTHDAGIAARFPRQVKLSDINAAGGKS